MALGGQLFEQACANGKGEPGGCYMRAQNYFTGDGVAKDMPRALKYFTLACDAGDAGACYMLGAIYGNGDGVTADRARAIGYFQQALKYDPDFAPAKNGLRSLGAN